ncbi:hypothetical protein [Micromonospora siamensis]|uniref:Uncharacterized protein n=1 Tax=Micromonospora siamensis TaxID=299152 RepID=A0A1C5K5B7_9ACTN|nr:hypothetical protein [Micromonospora siamensis]SCG77596.1 hypothetical protein GA0074704_5481 [Micromonospora siamensis]
MGARRSAIGLAVATGLLVAGCDGAAPAAGPGPGRPAGAGPEASAGGRSAPAHPPAAAPTPTCPPDNRLDTLTAGGGGELVGNPGVFWALLFHTEERLRPGQRLKIALKMTGSGALTARAVGPDGATVEPEGLDTHGDSDWRRPGDEWGSYWVFPTAGCWTVQAERADGTRGAFSLRAG